jgi:hypothetical protein
LYQFMSSVVIGLGGGNILTQYAQKQADRATIENLTAAVETATADTPEGMQEEGAEP